MVATQQRLGALLVDMGFIDDAQLASALEEQQRTEKRLGKILVEASVLSEDRLVHALSRQLGIEACDPIMTRVHDRVLALIPASVAFKYRVLPVARQREADQRDVVYVATADPLDDETLRVVSQTLGEQTRVQWMLAGETEMELALARHYGQRGRALPEGTKVITGVPVAGPPRSPEVEEGARSVLASTDDIFRALNDGDGATTHPDRPAPSLDIDLSSADLSSGDFMGPGEDDDPPVADSSTEEILLADDVVPFEGGGLSPALAAQLNGPADRTLLDEEDLRGPPDEALMGLPAVPDFADDAMLAPDVIDALAPEAEETGPAGLRAEEATYGSTSPSGDITDELLAASRMTVETPEHVRENPPPFRDGQIGPRYPSASGLTPSSASDWAPNSDDASWGDLLSSATTGPLSEDGEPTRGALTVESAQMGERGRPVSGMPASRPVSGGSAHHSLTGTGDLMRTGAGPTAGGSIRSVFDGPSGDPITDDVGDGAPRTLDLLREVVESMPVAEPGFGLLSKADIVVAHPAAPFPPLESAPEIEEPDTSIPAELDEIVTRFSGVPTPPRAASIAEARSPSEAAAELHRELKYFAAGGVLDLTSQQRVLRTLATVMMQEGLLDPERIERALVLNAAQSESE